MTDIVDKETRSRMMSGIRGWDTKPEMRVRRFLHRQGFRYRLHDRKLPGRPDIVLPKHKAVVLVHGCFWHRHPGCEKAYMPQSNRRFWREKLNGNAERDLRTETELRGQGWRVFHIWECEADDPDVLDTLAQRLGESAERQS